MSLINVIYNDKSGTTKGTLTSVGATVIKSKRGGEVPVLFNAGQSKRILDYFGIPNIGNEAVDDILHYNNSYPIWVSAPSTGSLYGGVLVGEEGTSPFIGGQESKDISFKEINFLQPFGVGDGEEVSFNGTIGTGENYKAKSIDIVVDGVALEAEVTGDEGVETLVFSGGSGTHTIETGDLTLTFNTAPSLGSTIEVSYESDQENSLYFMVFNKNPQKDDLATKISSLGEGLFLMELFKKSGTKYTPISGFPVEFSIVPDTKNGFGQNIYAPVLLKDSDYIEVVVNPKKTFEGDFDDSDSPVDFSGGKRGTTGTTELTAGWEYFKNPNKYRADIFFDTTAEDGISTIFQTLRESYQKYSYFILPTANASVADTLTNYGGKLVDNRGLAYYWGWGKVENIYTGDLMASSLMGRRAFRLAEMADVFNGLAPAWYNENGKYGGQLGAGIVEMFYDADEDEQESLYQARINPTVIHPTFGVVNTRERTSQSLLSDYASIGHTRLVDYLVRNIIEQALPYQLYKLNDFGHRLTVKSKIESIISPTMAEPFNLLRDFIVKCDEENNDDAVLAREEFVVNVAIKITPFSKYINLFFTNSAQGTNVSEDV